MPKSIVTHLRDFPDRLPPMLVKELRQGLRANAFVVVFLVLQGLLGIVLLTAVAAESSSRAGTSVSSIIFFFISLALIIFQPLRGVSALASEMKANTMEIMALTRLSAWRITFGKWSAIVSQSALLVTAIIPYLILRYFLGGMQLFAELLMLLMIFILSATLTAVTVGMSGNRALALRVLFPLALVPLGISAMATVFFEFRVMTFMIEFFSLTSPENREIAAVIVFFAVYIGWLALDFGASLIAPISENRATVRRIVGLGLALVVILLLRPLDHEVQLFVSALFLVPLVLVSLAEPINVTVPMLRSFTQRGAPWRLASWFLCPGWAAGALYSLLLVVMFGAAISSKGMAEDAWIDFSIHAYGAIGALIFPAVVLLFFKVANRFASYLIILASSVVLMGFLSLVADMMNKDGLLFFFVWLPPVAWALAEETGDYASIAFLCALLGGFFTLVLLIGAVLATKRLHHSFASPAAES
jgi:hypothetical protein